MSGRYLTTSRYRDLLGQLSDRDYAVLQHVATLRFISGDQLTRLCFAASGDPASVARTARRSLVRLVRLGALERLARQVGGRRAGSAGYVYHLGPVGQRLAAERGWQPARRVRRSRTPGSLFVRHTLAVAEVHTRLIEASRKARVELLELAAEPSCWRSFDGSGSQRSTLKPDSYVRLGLGAYEDSYFLEVDRGTEGSRTLERQLQCYVAYHRSGQEQAARQVFPRVLWTVPSERRAAVVLDCIGRLPREHRRLFQVARFDQAIAHLLATNDNNDTATDE